MVRDLACTIRLISHKCIKPCEVLSCCVRKHASKLRCACLERDVIQQ